MLDHNGPTADEETSGQHSWTIVGSSPLRDAVASLDEIDSLPEGEPESPDERSHDGPVPAGAPSGFSSSFDSGSTGGVSLQSLGERISAEIDDLTVRLDADSMTPDAALERLDDLTDVLSAAIAALQDQQVGRLAEDEEEAELLREIEVHPEDHDGPTYRSVRARRRALTHIQDEESGAAGTAWHLNPVLWYSIWHSESNSELESHRNPATGSGSTSGFSSGGFSGAGSSSRF